MPTYQLDIGRTPACLLLMFDFKSETNFGFFIEKYIVHVFWIYCKTSKRARLASFRVLGVFQGILSTVSAPELKIDFLPSQTIVRVLCAYIMCVQLVRA